MKPRDYNRLRKDFIACYEREACPESIEAVRQAQDVDIFLDLLHQYAHYLWSNGLSVPTTEWVRRWFSEQVPLLNHHYIILDQHTSVRDPVDSVIVMGDSVLRASLIKPGRYVFHIMDTAHLTLSVYNTAVVHVYKHSASCDHFVVYRQQTATIKVHPYETHSVA